MCWFLRRGENRSTRRKTSRSKDENQQQTQPTYDTGTGSRTRATLVGGERSHHCAIPAPPSMVHAYSLSFSAPHFQLHVTIKVPLPSHMISFNFPLLGKRAVYFWITFFTSFLQFSGFHFLVACCSAVRQTDKDIDIENLFTYYSIKSFVVKRIAIENLLVYMWLGN